MGGWAGETTFSPAGKSDFSPTRSSKHSTRDSDIVRSMDEVERDRFMKSIEELQRSDAKVMGEANVFLFAMRSAFQTIRKKAPLKTFQEGAIDLDHSEAGSEEEEGGAAGGKEDAMYVRSPTGQRVRSEKRKYRDKRPGAANTYEVFGPAGGGKMPPSPRGGKKQRMGAELVGALEKFASGSSMQEKVAQGQVGFFHAKTKAVEADTKRKEEKDRLRAEKDKLKARKEQLKLYRDVKRDLDELSDDEDKKAMVTQMGLEGFFPKLFSAKAPVSHIIHPPTEPPTHSPTHPPSLQYAPTQTSPHPPALHASSTPPDLRYHPPPVRNSLPPTCPPTCPPPHRVLNLQVLSPYVQGKHPPPVRVHGHNPPTH